MHLFAEIPSFGVGLFLVVAVGLALSFEFVNGFHDTANAVATVIYTNTLKPNVAVVWSGVWNLVGVLSSGTAVAYGIVSLLPVELVINVGSTAGFAMAFSLLISAIVWNVGTWWFGIPASSSHTLIGAILGVGLGNSIMSPGYTFGEGVNWGKAGEVGMSLVVSPIVGFACAAVLLLLVKILVRQPALYRAPETGKAPPPWIRGLLMLTCTGVSFAHGSNDGQKGMGLIVLILVGVLPGSYALKMSQDPAAIRGIVTMSQTAAASFEKHAPGDAPSVAESREELGRYLKAGRDVNRRTFPALAVMARDSARRVDGVTNYAALPEDQRRILRADLYLEAESAGKLIKSGRITDADERRTAADFKQTLESSTKFVPEWVKYAVAVALGLGTMIGWKRIVVTVGEKIGKDHLSYAQGAAAEMVTMATIGGANILGLPVSTTHVLSSGVAGAMAANHSGLQTSTLRNLLFAWVLTLPVCIFLGASIFSFVLYVLLHILGLK